MIAPMLGSWMARFQKFSNRPWYLPLGGLLAGLDFFILVVPTDGLAVTSVLLQKKRWFATAVAFALGSTLGGVIMAWMTLRWGEPFVTWLLGDALHSASWSQTSQFVIRHGAKALLLFAASPLPLQLPIAICSLAHMPLLEMAGLLLLGRFFKFTVLCGLASRAPKLLGRFRKVADEVQEIEVARLDEKSGTERKE